MTATDNPRPWVLLRKGKPPARFEAREAAQRFYDGLRFNAGTDIDAVLFGPGGEAWYCRRFRSAVWERDDGRAKRPASKGDVA